MAVPKYDELMKPLLTAVKDGEVYKIKDVTAVLAPVSYTHLSMNKLIPIRIMRDLFQMMRLK